MVLDKQIQEIKTNQVVATGDLAELEKLRVENAKLMKLLDEKCRDPDHKGAKFEDGGFCAVTC